MTGISRRGFMARLGTSGLAVAAGAVLPDQAAAGRRGEVLVLRGGTQIDGTGGRPRHDCGHRGGTVQPGKWADLLVADADPLADIRNTQRIHAVVTHGRLITRADRERMLADVEAEAKITPPPGQTAATACPCTLTHQRAFIGRNVR